MTLKKADSYVRTLAIATVVCIITFLILRGIGSGVILEFRTAGGQHYIFDVQDALLVMVNVTTLTFLAMVVMTAVWARKKDDEE